LPIIASYNRIEYKSVAVCKENLNLPATLCWWLHRNSQLRLLAREMMELAGALFEHFRKGWFAGSLELAE
jgi:hypothetical protein